MSCGVLFSAFAVGRTVFLVKGGVGCCLLPGEWEDPLLSRFKQASGVLESRPLRSLTKLLPF